MYARADEVLYLHGAPLSRLLKGLADRSPMCLTVTHVDGLVLARSAFHSSVNYRSVMVIGRGRAIRDRDEKLAALDTLVEHMAPGRTREARGPSPQELRATEVIALPIDEASAKIRTGPPVDANRDYALPIWAGELPLELAADEPVSDERCSVPVSASARGWSRGRASELALESARGRRSGRAARYAEESGCRSSSLTPPTTRPPISRRRSQGLRRASPPASGT